MLKKVSVVLGALMLAAVLGQGFVASEAEAGTTHWCLTHFDSSGSSENVTVNGDLLTGGIGDPSATGTASLGKHLAKHPSDEILHAGKCLPGE